MNEHELESMRKVFNNLRKNIEPLSESPKILKLRERVTKIRKDSIDNNEELLQTARQSFKENDIDLFNHSRRMILICFMQKMTSRPETFF